MPLSRRLVPCLRALSLVAAVVAGVGASHAQSPTLASKAEEADTLLSKAAAAGEVRVIVTLRDATPADPATLPSSSTTAPSSAQSVGGPLGDGQTATPQQTQFISRHLGSNFGKRDRWSPRLIPNAPYLAVTVNAAELEELAADPNVVSIHEDGIMRPGLQDSVPLIGMPAAFARGATGINRMVAVMDTGVEYGHVFTTARVTNATCFSTTNATYTTLCPNGMATQIGGTAGINCGVAGCNHGTHVAGIAAGNRASGAPLSGVAKQATILAVQVFSRRNSDNALGAFDSDMLAALNDTLTRVSTGGELASRGLRAINMSIWDVGFQVAGNCDANARAVPFKTVIDNLLARNVATVIISGNNAQRGLSAFPGCVSSAVTVSSTNKTDAVSSFSNVSAIVDLFAPGESINSANNPTPNFTVLSGTSMAAPHVAGAFAAISSVCPTATVGQIESALETTGALVSDTRAGGTLTFPRIRVDRAVERLCAPKNDLVVDLGVHGLFRRQNGVWARLNTQSPTLLEAADLNGNGKDEVIVVFASGTWIRWDNGTWLKLNTRKLTVAAVGDLDNNGQQDIAAAFSGLSGLFVLLNKTPPWVRLNTASPQLLKIADLNGNNKGDIIAVFANGTWVRYDNGTWRRLNTNRLSLAAVGDVDGNAKQDLVGAFAFGLFVLPNNAFPWVRLNTQVPRDIAVGDVNGNGKDDIVIVFPSGTWIRYDSGVWVKRDTRPLVVPAIADLDGMLKEDVVGGFAGLGLFTFLNNNPPFLKLHSVVPQDLTAARLD